MKARSAGWRTDKAAVSGATAEHGLAATASRRVSQIGPQAARTAGRDRGRGMTSLRRSARRAGSAPRARPAGRAGCGTVELVDPERDLPVRASWKEAQAGRSLVGDEPGLSQPVAPLVP